VHSRDAWWEAKRAGEKNLSHAPSTAHPIHLPKNTPLGFIIAVLSFFFGFGIVWHIWWLVVLSAILMLATVIIRSFDDATEYEFYPHAN
jgi:cytochrome o ubiquinol oxidase subunit 1